MLPINGHGVWGEEVSDRLHPTVKRYEVHRMVIEREGAVELGQNTT